MRGPLGWARHCGKVCTASIQPRRSESRRGPLTLVRSAHPTSPRAAGRGEMCAFALATRSASELYPWRGAKPGNPLRYPPLATCFSLPSQKKKGGRTPTDADPTAALARGARSAERARLLGVPPRLSPEGIIPSQRLGSRPGFLGTRSERRYPPSPAPVQGAPPTPVIMPGG